MSNPRAFASTVTRLQVLDEARAWIGTPYVHQASMRGAGSDCLGLVRGVWRSVYGAEPELPPAYTPDWTERSFKDGRGPETLLDAARRHLKARPQNPGARAFAFEPGDVLIFRVASDGPAKHCGIATGPDKFIHAYAGRAVVEGWLNRWWRARLVGVFVYPGTEE